MSDPAQSTDNGGNTGATPPETEFKPITSQDELNRIIGERVKRAKPADYDDLRAKASRLDELEQANKTELEKANERAEAAEREREKAAAESLRWRVAAKHGISDEDAELFLTGTDEATLSKQAERLAGRNNDRRKQGNVVPREGSNPKPAEDKDAVARAFFGITN